MSDVAWASYVFYQETDGEFSSHIAFFRGRGVGFVVHLYANDFSDPCAYVPHPPKKATLTEIKDWFTKYSKCLECDRSVPGLNA